MAFLELDKIPCHFCVEISPTVATGVRFTISALSFTRNAFIVLRVLFLELSEVAPPEVDDFGVCFGGSPLEFTVFSLCTLLALSSRLDCSSVCLSVFPYCRFLRGSWSRQAHSFLTGNLGFYG